MNGFYCDFVQVLYSSRSLMTSVLIRLRTWPLSQSLSLWRSHLLPSWQSSVNRYVWIKLLSIKCYTWDSVYTDDSFATRLLFVLVFGNIQINRGSTTRLSGRRKSVYEQGVRTQTPWYEVIKLDNLGGRWCIPYIKLNAHHSQITYSFCCWWPWWVPDKIIESKYQVIRVPRV